MLWPESFTWVNLPLLYLRGGSSPANSKMDSDSIPMSRHSSERHFALRFKQNVLGGRNNRCDSLDYLTSVISHIIYCYCARRAWHNGTRLQCKQLQFGRSVISWTWGTSKAKGPCRYTCLIRIGLIRIALNAVSGQWGLAFVFSFGHMGGLAAQQVQLIHPKCPILIQGCYGLVNYRCISEVFLWSCF